MSKWPKPTTPLWHIFLETVTCSLLRLINTAVVELQNELTGSRSPTVPDDSFIHVPMKHDFSEAFERENFDDNIFGKGELHSIC